MPPPMPPPTARAHTHARTLAAFFANPPPRAQP
jgi:hypothetical protein